MSCASQVQIDKCKDMVVMGEECLRLAVYHSILNILVWYAAPMGNAAYHAKCLYLIDSKDTVAHQCKHFVARA